jgi:hypothetical protein
MTPAYYELDSPFGLFSCFFLSFGLRYAFPPSVRALFVSLSTLIHTWPFQAGISTAIWRAMHVEPSTALLSFHKRTRRVIVPCAI